jgi:hypothetical protein
MYFRLCFQCYLRPIRPHVLPPNLTYIFRFLPLLPWANLSYTSILLTFHVPNLVSIFFRVGHLFRESVKVRGLLWTFVPSLFLRWGVVSSTPDPPAKGPPLVGCPRHLIQYIRSYSPFLEGISSIRNLRARNAVVARDPHNMEHVTLLIVTYVVCYRKSENTLTLSLSTALQPLCTWAAFSVSYSYTQSLTP